VLKEALCAARENQHIRIKNTTRPQPIHVPCASCLKSRSDEAGPKEHAAWPHKARNMQVAHYPLSTLLALALGSAHLLHEVHQGLGCILKGLTDDVLLVGTQLRTGIRLAHSSESDRACRGRPPACQQQV
jgi:hypothetical protein